MEFKVIKKTPTGILLEPIDHENAVKTRCPVFLRGKKVAVIMETIGRVSQPLYLAKPTTENELIGKKVSTKR